MEIIITVISKSVNSIFYLAFLLILFVYIYSLLGLQIYKGKIPLEELDNSFNNFDSFFNASITVFQIMTLEGWNNLFFICLQIKSVHSFTTYCYFISWICFGHYVLLNLFMAILLDGFSNINELDYFEEGSQNLDVIKIEKNRFSEIESLKKKSESQKEIVTHHENSLKITKKKKTKIIRKFNKIDEMYENLPCKKSLFLFPKKNFVRKYCFKIVNNKFFEFSILVIIIISSLKLTGDSFLLNPKSDIEYTSIEVSNRFDILFNYIFIMEAGIKVISFGFYFDEECYLKDKWNFLDFFIACSATIDMTFDNIDWPIIKVFRILRALKPLRIISHNENFKIATVALFGTISSLLNIFLVIFIIWLIN